MEKQCDRCGVRAQDTEMGILAYNGSRLVCSDCDSDLDDEWCADNGDTHPIDALNPTAVYFAQRRSVADAAIAAGYVGAAVTLDPLS